MHVRMQVVDCGYALQFFLIKLGKRHVSFTAYDLLKCSRFKGSPIRAITRIDDVVVFKENKIVRDTMGTYIWNWRNCIQN